jgi:hypothetical protein
MKRPSARVTVLASIAMLVLSGPALAAVRIPGTSVTLDAPDGFAVSREPRGLKNAATGSEIAITEFPPEAYANLADVFTSPKTAAERFGRNGTAITRIEHVNIDSSSVPLAIGGQRVNGRNFTKYIALMGGIAKNNKTVLITLDIAESAPFEQSDVETLLRSVSLGHVATLEEKLSKLTFHYAEVEPFHTTDTISSHTAMLSSEEDFDRSSRIPNVVIVRASTGATPEETQQFSETALRGIAGFAEATITERRPIKFAGGDGYYLAAIADERSIEQYLRVFPGGNFIRLVARGETRQLADFHEAIAEIAATVELR